MAGYYTPQIIITDTNVRLCRMIGILNKALAGVIKVHSMVGQLTELGP